MPRIFIDTDVAFDIVSKREPHYQSILPIVELASKGSIEFVIAESGLGNLIYLAYEIYKLKEAETQLSDLFTACKIVHGGKQCIIQAFDSAFKDKEDALQYYTALHNECDYFLTRNIKDYKHAVKNLPVLTPDNFSKL